MSTIDIIPILSAVIIVPILFFLVRKKTANIKTKIILGVLIISGLGMLVIYLFVLQPKYSDAYAVTEITFFKSRKGNLLFVQNISSGLKRSSHSRLSILNAESGKIEHTILTGLIFRDRKYLDMIVVTDDKIWFSHYKIGLHARDPYTGKILITEKDIIKKYPQLNGSSKVQVKTDDGYVFESKPPDFKLKMISYPLNKLNSGESWHRQYEESHPYTYGNLKPEELQIFLYNLDTSYFHLTRQNDIAILDNENGFSFENNDPDDRDIMQLMHATYNAGYSGYKVDTCINKELNLRNPFIVENYLLHRPKSLLVGHYEYNEKRKLHFLLSRVDLTGNILWTLKQDQLGGEPNLYSLNNGILYLAVKGKVVSVDPYKGIKKWAVQL